MGLKNGGGDKLPVLTIVNTARYSPGGGASKK